ncbi:hypothetical protein JOM56_010040 [Amanita muscaria]
MPTFQGASNTSNQIPPTRVNTGGGAHFESAHFTGGGHAFGNNYNLMAIQSGNGQFTEVQRDLIRDHIATLAALPDINDNLRKHPQVLTQSIIRLPRAEAVFNDYQNMKKSGPCFEGTRVELLREMADWFTSSGESRMYVLSGLAGIGKSTVAYTIASRAADLDLLGASFFFSRDEADRNNANLLFTTIAYQLCVYNETFATAIGDVLLTERGSLATTLAPQEQLQVLILDPLRNIVQSRARPVLVVVDALDECDEEDGLGVVVGLSRLVLELPSFKVILTTRPQPHLGRFLGSQGGHKIFRLHDIEDMVVDGDIRLYLSHSLSLEAVQERYPHRQWSASGEEIASLVGSAGRLFIIASTAVRYILDKSASNPAAQMQKLLRAFAQYLTPFEDLDQLYTIILRNVVPDNCDDDDIVSRYQLVVGALISVQRPLPVSTLAHLTIDMDVEDIHAVLEKLQSVIVLGDNDVPRIYHKSFTDYLTDQARCKDPRLRIDLRVFRHMQIERMTKLLIERAGRLTTQSDFHGTDHFAHEFGELIKRNPQAIELHTEEWEQTLRPLLNVLERLLRPSKLDSLKAGYCQQCRFFQNTYDILTQFKSLRETEDPDVEKCVKSLQEIIQYGDSRQQDFDMNFGHVVFGWGTIVGVLVAILAHQR